MSKPITLSDEISDVKREIGLRERKYPEWAAMQTDPSKRAKLEAAHAHQLACIRSTLARLEAMLPQQQTLLL